MDTITMGYRIKRRRKNLGLTQEELAEQTNVSINHISAIENSKENPSLSSLLRICDSLNTTPDYVLLGTTRSNNTPARLIESLRLCDTEDIELLTMIAEYLLQRKHG